MRKKEKKLIVTFHTTAEAIGLEKLCKARGMAGRMIPVPRELSAGCGLAWCCDSHLEQEIVGLLNENDIDHEEMVQILY